MLENLGRRFNHLPSPYPLAKTFISPKEPLASAKLAFPRAAHSERKGFYQRLLNNKWIIKMKMRSFILQMFRENPDMLRLPLESEHGWRSSPDEGDHSHCTCCGKNIYIGDPVVGCYLKYVSVVFCPECVDDNPELFRIWVARGPGPSIS
jgi:hypothetical protein